ncbi:MAG: hypothetical protein JWM96_1067, partial [Alphaproteobacteria bacterium]|nr:hypothetical protein [Alphaproteobacteria bacterium]
TGKAPRDKNTVLRETRAPYVAYSGLSKIISTRPILMPNVLEDKIRARDFARNAAKIDLFDPSYDPSGLSTRLQTSLYKNMPAAQEGVIYPVGFILQHCQGRYDQEEDIIYTQAALKENPSLEKDTVPSFLCTVTCMQPGSSFQIALKHAETTPEMLGMFHESLDDMTQLEKQFIDPAYEEDDKLCWAQRIMEKNFGPDPMHHSQARLNLTNLRCLPASTRTHATG